MRASSPMLIALARITELTQVSDEHLQQQHYGTLDNIEPVH
jgi:hypothetical protein